MASQTIWCLDKNHKTGHLYEDNLCFFGVLACRGLSKRPANIEIEAKCLSKMWLAHKGLTSEQFKGVDIRLDIVDLEEFFQVNVRIFALDELGNATPVYKSSNLYTDTIYCNLHENHLSYINNFSQYARHYFCRSCGKSWPSLKKLNRHELKCENAFHIKV